VATIREFYSYHVNLYVVGDATILLRDVVAETAQKAAAHIRPSEEQLAQVDQPADENVWHDMPDLSKGKAKAAVKSQLDKLKPAVSSIPPFPRFLRNILLTISQGRETTGDDQQGAAADTDAAPKDEDVPAETKKRSRDLADRVKAFLSEKMPEERRDQTIWRLKKMLIEIQGRSDCE